MSQTDIETDAAVDPYSENVRRQWTTCCGAFADIRPLARRLGRRSPLRKIVPSVLTGRRPACDDFDTLLATLARRSERRWDERVVAARLLQIADLSPGQAEAAERRLRAVLEERTGWDVPRRFLFVVSRYAALGLLWFATLWIVNTSLGWVLDWNHRLAARFGSDAEFVNVWISVVVIVGGAALGAASLLVALVSLCCNLDRAAHVRAAAAGALGRLGLRESAGALAAACCERHSAVRASAAVALRKVLPSFRAEHYGQLRAEVVPNLCRLVDDRNEALALAVLDALGKVGDSRALPAVTRAAREGLTQQTRDAANRILPALIERERSETASGVLLRQARDPGTQAGELLRSAQSAPEACAETLLRPGPPDDPQ